ncbi:hypothetical protein [Tessaracoccus sp. OH4464_COT-324]|uniref:hypothetical protein n=1 Tax=Tessaracoccus sp. OH4464_COT-324 TaxID=2491059 RepID=UPI000F63B8FC|nr:hypothetical protein [Tessaracoccus sp. OH4464_COT-324]RRD47430.1 hypothetical protein EII42_02235 [Tessaracoccus sp. OH4464_COT-324]
MYEDELLAPPGMEEQDEFAEAGGLWRLSHGFTDSRHVVRIWVERDSGAVHKVKLSQRWRDRLSGRSLSDAFLEAYFVAYITCDVMPKLPESYVPRHSEEFRGTIDDVQERISAVLDRIDELDARAPENVRWGDFRGEPQGATVRGVAVWLSPAGIAERIEFDRRWLLNATDAEITDSVQQAHKIAYDHFVPPTYVPGEREELVAELEFLQATAQSLMTEGIA